MTLDEPGKRIDAYIERHNTTRIKRSLGSMSHNTDGAWGCRPRRGGTEQRYHPQPANKTLSNTPRGAEHGRKGQVEDNVLMER